MSLFSRAAMAEALRLTRSGDLMSATNQILATLSGGPQPRPGFRDASQHVPDQLRIMTQSPESKAEVSRITSACFEHRTYVGPAGTLSYRLYIPANATADMPLVVMLHGCTQAPEDFARGTGMNTLADEFGILVAYPEQTQAANPQKCWNWFRPGDQQRDRGEPALLAGITRAIVAEERVDPARIYVAGLSAGGATAAILADTYPDIFAAVGIHSGLAAGAARNVPAALTAMRQGGKARTPKSFVPVITFHGDRDQTVNAKNSAAIIAAATAAAPRLIADRETGRSAGGRSYSRESFADPSGRTVMECWTVHSAGHAWSGGSEAGSYTDPAGPDASREMLRFFLSLRHS